MPSLALGTFQPSFLAPLLPRMFSGFSSYSPASPISLPGWQPGLIPAVLESPQSWPPSPFWLPLPEPSLHVLSNPQSLSQPGLLSRTTHMSLRQLRSAWLNGIPCLHSPNWSLLLNALSGRRVLLYFFTLWAISWNWLSLHLQVLPVCLPHITGIHLPSSSSTTNHQGHHRHFPLGRLQPPLSLSHPPVLSCLLQIHPQEQQPE